ncbi:MAG: MltA domain-containing protein [Deltaproteobacteria bacterium]|nr:MltA domain-containing protein [Deltaproteobacteria bacterium]
MRRIVITIIAALIFLAIVWLGRHLFYPIIPEKLVAYPLASVSRELLPRFSDDLDGAHLHEALSLHIEQLRTRDLDQLVNFGEMQIPRRRLLATLELFCHLLTTKGISSLEKEIPRYFIVWQAAGANRKGDVLFTGYYQPVLDARLSPEGEYRYPLYRPPDDLQVIDLGEINPLLAGEKVGLRVEKGVIQPYYDRRAIDDDKALVGRGLELVFLKDFLDRYMLHVQGSGVMKVEDGRQIKVGFAASNYFPYTSLGKLLVADGLMAKEAVSLRAIREYCQKHPEVIERYLNKNRRYIFFEEFTGETAGSEGVPLTPGRSIATDKTVFPGGGLAYISFERKVRNVRGDIVQKHPINRFMIDQDTGAAMKGPGRADIFWGTGDDAGKAAGSIKETGALYYLLIKEGSKKTPPVEVE